MLVSANLPLCSWLGFLASRRERGCPQRRGSDARAHPRASLRACRATGEPGWAASSASPTLECAQRVTDLVSNT